MKKIFVLVSILTLPAFADTDATKLYGDTANITVSKTASVATTNNDTPKTEPVALQEETLNETENSTTGTTESWSEPAKDFESRKTYSFESSNPDIKFPHGLQLGVGLSGTTGLNGFIGYNNKKFDSFWWKRLGVRFDFATMSPVKNKLNSQINSAIGDEGIEIDDHLSIEDIAMNSKHYGVLVDVYPFGDTWFLGGLRLSGGYMFGKMDLDAKLHGKNIGSGIEFELNGHKYRYDGTEMYGTANLDWKLNGPYAGLGFDLGIFRGFKIYMDAGVVFTNQTAKMDLDVPLNNLKDVNANALVQGNTLLEQAYRDAKTEALAEAQKELDKYPYYPIVKLGFMYRF